MCQLLGASYSRPPIDPYLTSPLLQNHGVATGGRSNYDVSGEWACWVGGRHGAWCRTNAIVEAQWEPVRGRVSAWSLETWSVRRHAQTWLDTAAHDATTAMTLMSSQSATTPVCTRRHNARIDHYYHAGTGNQMAARNIKTYTAT